ncbi:MAG: RNA methyltransferase [Deltaproteobacteria bacterium]|nr:RNA methyltransferase [Deltaproteobacteria bacterium]
MLADVHIVLSRPRYSANVGSVARACLNMGCPNLILVDPENWRIEEALPLATHHARHILEEARIVPDLGTALTGFHHVYGTTARTGGWRRNLRFPDQAAPLMAEQLAHGDQVALVFGPENTGLANEEIELCGQLLIIPTAPDMTSLNLAQAVLIVLYECLKAVSRDDLHPVAGAKDRLITQEERERCLQKIMDALLAIDYLKPDSAEYHMLPFRRFMGRSRIHLYEYNMLMGLCRQVMWMAGQTMARHKCPENSTPTFDHPPCNRGDSTRTTE